MTNINIQLERANVEVLLTRYKDIIGNDFPAYRNHVYRSITYAMYFLDDDPKLESLVETIFVYHDIGLWTDQALAYLEPSEAAALADNEKYEWGLAPEILQGGIHWHHKIFSYKGPNKKIIEACRKADWIDASKGVIRKGLSRSTIKAVEAAFPNLGFHNTLLRLAKEYGGSTLAGGVKVTRGIVKW